MNYENIIKNRYGDITDKDLFIIQMILYDEQKKQDELLLKIETLEKKLKTFS